MLLAPVVEQLLSEVQDVCGSDCTRIVSFDRGALPNDKDEVDSYWLRLEPDGLEEAGGRRLLRLEKFDAPCVVGFAVDKEHCCPLFGTKPTVKGTGEMLSIIERVAAFRKAQAAEKRAADKEEAARRQNKANDPAQKTIPSEE